MTVDEAVFCEHVQHGNFLDGVSRGKWKIVRQEWPHVWIEVRAAQRDPSSDAYVLRFDCTNYPQSAPTAVLWDLGTNTPLAHDRWPAGTGSVGQIFRTDWNNGSALYFGMDRAALTTHQKWPLEHPNTVWNPGKEITDYLDAIYGPLNSPHYKGTRCSISSSR